MATTPTLAAYPLDSPTMLSTDASLYGLGAVCWRLVAYAFRAFSVVEQRYAQIEREVLAIC